MTPRELRAAACEYADLGWQVLPLKPRAKAPLGRLVPRGKDDATSDLATVWRWWAAVPRANVGLVAGTSGFVVIDVDPRNGGDDSLAELERTLGLLPETVSAKTGGGGWHYLFRHPGGTLLGVAADGVDVKDHGYIVAPPSAHPSGNGYAWDLGPGDVAVAELPASWRQAITVPERRTAPRSSGRSDPLRNLPAATYFPALTGRDVDRRGWACCPFHKGGQEKTPSLKVDETLWRCFACPPPPGKRAMGGTVYDLAAMLLGLPVPTPGAMFRDVKALVVERCG